MKNILPLCRFVSQTNGEQVYTNACGYSKIIIGWFK